MRLELTLPALERLIGGDTEIEVGLRQQILEEFTKHRIKTLINAESIKQINAEWSRQLNEVVRTTIKSLMDEKQPGALTEYSLYWDFSDAVKKAVQKTLDESVNETIERQLMSKVGCPIHPITLKTISTFDSGCMVSY